MNNENLHEIFGVTKNQISRIVNSLNKKGYTSNDYFYKNNQKVLQDNLKNVNVLKSKNENYKKYNEFHNYESRHYSKEALESLYANL